MTLPLQSKSRSTMAPRRATGLCRPLDTGSPHTFATTHTLESIKRAGAASNIRERHTSSRSWGGFGNSPPLQSSTTVRLGVPFFHDDRPTTSLAVWAYVAPDEATQDDVLLGSDSWMRSNDRSYRTLPPHLGNNRVYMELEPLFLTLRPTRNVSTCSTQGTPASRFLTIIDSSRSI